MIACIALAACLASPVQASTEDSEGPVVQLPVFTVTSERLLPPPESWRHAAVPGFEILSNASDRDTRRLIRRLQEFQQALSVVWPAVDSESSTPTLIVVCGKLGSFSEFRSPDEPQTRLGAASRYFRDTDSAAIVIDFSTSILDTNPYQEETAILDPDDDSVPDYSQREIEFDAHTELFREYVLFKLRAVRPRLPAWVEAGIAELLVSMDISPKRIVFGKVRGPSTVAHTAPDIAPIAIADPTMGPTFSLELSRRGLIPFGELFAVPHDGELARNPIGSKWVQESAAFLHMCLYGRRTTHQKALLKFVDRSRNEPPTEALFQECFGKGFKAMQLQLRGYIQTTDSTYLQFQSRGRGMPVPEPIALRSATEAEVGRIKGDALRLAGRMERARVNLIAPYNRGSRDPELLAALGLSEIAAGEPDRALRFLEASEDGTRRVRAHIELARLRLKKSIEAPGGPEGKFSPAQTALILGPLFKARSQPPLAPDGYELIAEAWEHSEIAPRREHLQVLDEGILMYPNRVSLVLRAAELNAANGYAEHTSVLAEFGTRIAADEQTRARFKSILARQAAAAP